MTNLAARFLWWIARKAASLAVRLQTPQGIAWTAELKAYNCHSTDNSKPRIIRWSMDGRPEIIGF